MPYTRGKLPTHPTQNKWALYANNIFDKPLENDSSEIEHEHPIVSANDPMGPHPEITVIPNQVSTESRIRANSNPIRALESEFVPVGTSKPSKKEAEEIEINVPKFRTPLEAAYAAKNGQIYTLNIPVDREANFFVIGCQGNGQLDQKDVAGLMNLIAAGNKPDFILILGDNFYDHGISSPEDPIIKKNFTDIYGNPLLKNIADIPCFAILGNHDENIHNLKKPWESKGVKRGMFQVARSYVAETVTGIGYQIQKFFSVNEKSNLYKKKNLDLGSLPKWNMPSRYYSLIAGNTQIFCIDSNTYVNDYLTYQAALQSGKPVDQDNQAVWLEREVAAAKAAGRKVILADHHPILTPGKRSFGSDTKLYLESDAQKSFERIYKDFYAGTTDQTIRANKESYNTLLRETFKMQWKTQQRQNKDFTFDTIFAAHDHDLYYINNKNKPGEFPVCEIVSGGGGGHLQKLVKYDDHLAFFMKQHGFVRCETFPEPTFGEPTLKYHVYTTNKRDRDHHLVFTEKSTKPLRDYSSLNPAERKAVENFCAIVREAIDEYLKFITAQQVINRGKFFSRNFSHGEQGVERAHKLWAYISNHEVDNLAKTIETVFEMTKWKGIFTAPTEHSLLMILDRKVKENYKGANLEKLSKKAMKLSEHRATSSSSTDSRMRVQ